LLASFDPQAIEDLAFWVRTRPRTALRVLELVEAAIRDPYAGIGKPEPLKHRLRGCWSRRIDQEHRLVYRVEGGQVVFLAARFHYE
jgi:toxin YoeB